MQLRVLQLGLLVALSGCGAGLKEFPTAAVTGKVLCEGKPVANVRINFAPIAKEGKTESGMMGMGVAKEDGTFVVSTYGQEDGAVVGKHSVSVSTPHPEDFPNFNCNCLTVGNRQPVMEFEVKSGESNTIEINLPPKRNKNIPSIDPQDLRDIQQSAQGVQ